MAYIYTFGLCDVEYGDVYSDISFRADDDRQVIQYIVDNMEQFMIIFEEIYFSNSHQYLNKNIKMYDIPNFPEKIKEEQFRNDFIIEAKSVINKCLENNKNITCDILFNSSNHDISTYSIIKIKVSDIINI